MKLSKIDWPNHLIAFLSSLLGILIAFQLQNYSDNRGQREQMKNALESIRKEIMSNLAIYQYNADSLSAWVDYATFYYGHIDSSAKGLVATPQEIDSFRIRNPSRVAGIRQIRKFDGARFVYDAPFVVDVTPMTGISTSNWDAARSSGILNALDHDLVVSLTDIYNWINLDLGQSDRDFFRMITDHEMVDDAHKIQKQYDAVARVARFKGGRIGYLFRNLKPERTGD